MTEISTVISQKNTMVECGCTTAGCSDCSGNSFCNVKGHSFTATNPKNIPLSEGDLIEVFLPPGKTVFSGFMVLIFPLILFFLGFVLTGTIVTDAGEGIKALGGFIGLAAGFGIGYLFGKINKKKYMPIVEKKISDGQ